MHPRFAGVPWWGAVLVAVTATAVGFAFDAGSGGKELSAVFAVCYALGCLSAVLAVQQVGLFTAVVQPPLLLFVAVPGAYFLFHGGELNGLKDLAINCGYPLIERFPLMLFVSAAVLLIGLGRWYAGLNKGRGAEPNDAAATTSADAAGATAPGPLAGIVSAVTAKLSGLVLRKPATARGSTRRARAGAPDSAADRPRRRPSERPTRRRPADPDADPRPAARRPRTERTPTTRTAPPRPRRRPTAEAGFDTGFGPGFEEKASERPRRPRPPRASAPGPDESRRRVRTQPREPRRQPPPQRRRDPDLAAPRETARERPQRAQRPRRRFDDYQSFEEPIEPPNGSGRSTHHPVSRVRYRED